MGDFFPLRDPVISEQMSYSLTGFTTFYLNFVLQEKHLFKIIKNQMFKQV